ncbi:MAG TPA: hypothetical protein VHZ97_11950, partial [Pseudonocardiaceae bacterium]|nr:hypothetical protein [Pseudonocardiaceae bacterium]
MTALDDLESARALLAFASWAGPSALAVAIEDALAPPGPTGSPSVINAQAAAYAKTAAQCGVVAKDISVVATSSLPQAWKGAVAETAAQAVNAVAEDVQNMRTVLDRVVPALRNWASDLTAAQAGDAAGIAILNEAKSSLGFLGIEFWHLPTAIQQATDGLDMRIAAAQVAKGNGTSTASLLNQ